MTLHLPDNSRLSVNLPHSNTHSRNAYGRLTSAVGVMQGNFVDQHREVEAFRQEIRALGESLISTAQSFRIYRERLSSINMGRLGKKSRRLAAIMSRTPE
ncbi:MAG: hypothetical protein MI741_24965 [Rhodospirillales bacterium]|nr:hypothetical protein [Rhodospirillales bacterium]